MDKVYQVFVSSTFSDLEGERRLVSDTLAKAGFIPTGMELFPASDLEQLAFIKRVIDRSDYYVVIIGGRYGSLADGAMSYTEKEYEYAFSKGIPVLAFLHQDPKLIPSGKTESEPSQQARLEAFRTRLKTSRIVAFWTDPHDLSTKVLTAVMNATNLAPGVGWVRGDNAVDPKVLQDMERLRIDNAQLQKRLDEIDTGELTFPSQLASPDSLISLDGTIVQTDGNPTGPKDISRIEKKVSVLIGDLFVRVYPQLLLEPADFSLQKILGAAAFGMIDEILEPNQRCEVSAANVHQLGDHLEALGLIKVNGNTSTVHSWNKWLTWEVTDKGRRFATRIRGIKASQPAA